MGGGVSTDIGQETHKTQFPEHAGLEGASNITRFNP